MNRTMSLALSLVLAVVLTGCSNRPPSRSPDIRGIVTSLDEGTNGTLSMRVVWDKDLGTQLQYDAAQVYVTSKTRVFATTTGNVADATKISSTQLRVRDIVEVWFTGAVRESYPVQVDASDVVVVGQLDTGQPLPTPPGLAPPESGQ